MVQRLVALLLTLMAIAAPVTLAQTVGGTIRGTVRDTSGSAVPGATLTATSERTGLSRTTVAGEAGEYVLPELPIGMYTVRATLQGFKEVVLTGIELNVAATAVVNVTLEVGAITERVSVVSAAPIVETTSGAVGNLISGTQVRELPLNGRSFVQLTQLMPGVSPPDTFDSTGKGLTSSASMRMSISGGATTANMWLVDGANNVDVGSNGTLLVFPSIDAIEEFKIHRNAYGPEFGQAGGAQVNIVTRSGTNEFQGSGYYFGRNDSLNTKEYFLERGSQPKQQLNRHDFGYTLGGPVARDRFFFFWSQEWNRERRGISRNGLVPTDAERNGDFSQSCGTRPIDPRTGQPFPGDRIPGDRLSAAGQLMLNLFPSATLAGCASPNWIQAVNTPIDFREESLRTDFKLSNATNLMVRYTNDSWKNDSPNAGSQLGLWGDDPFPAVDSTWDQPSRMVVAKLSQTLSNTAVNEFQFSYSSNRISIVSGGTDAELRTRINAAMPPIFPESQKSAGADRAHPLFWGGQGYGPLWTLAPWENSQDLFVWRDDFTKVAGSHTWKAGVLLSFNHKDELVEGGDFFEVPQLSGASASGTGNVLADFLVRDVAWGFGENAVEPRGRGRWRDYEFYAGDTWRIDNTLTFNYGVRWSFFRQPFTADDNIASFDPSAYNPALGSDPCNGLLLPDVSACSDLGFRGGQQGPNRALVRERYNNIAPRLGVAWDPTGEGRMAVRAGLGQSFMRERVIDTINLAANPPFVANRSGTRFLDSTLQPSNCAPTCFGAATYGVPTRALDTNAKTPYVWQWNVTVERELWPAGKVEIGYVASRGNNLVSRKNLNQVLPGDINGNSVDDRLEMARNQGNGGAQNAVRPFSAFGNNVNIMQTGRDGESRYDSLQTSMLSRFGRGSRFQASYTLSKLTGLDSSTGSFHTDPTAPFIDNTNIEIDRGRTALDRTHVFTANLIYMLPSLKSSPPLLRAIGGDWEVAAIATYASGPALTVTLGASDDLSGTGTPDNQRPNVVASEDCRADGSDPAQWLNPAKFTLTGFRLGTIGNAQRGVCRGPGLKNWDLGFFKNIHTGGRIRYQVRLEFFNLFNTVQFRDVNTTLGQSNLQFDTGNRATATTITGFTPSPTFGQARATRGGREVQYAIKILW